MREEGNSVRGGGAGDVEKLRLVGAARVALFHFLDFIDEIPGVLELPVDRREAHVGDGVDGLEFFHGAQTDDARGNIATGFGAEFGDDFVHQPLESFEFDGALLAGFGETGEEFVAVEGFEASVAFDDAEFDLLDGFVSGEAGSAGGALTATADPLAILNRA